MLINGMLFLLMAVFCVYALSKQKKEPEFYMKRHENALLAFVFVIGILVRILWFWKFPMGFNQDEASIGYDAFADLTFGMDRNADHNPVYSVAWGSGHSSLYILLLKPFISLFGLNVFSVRIVNALAGSLALFPFYGILKHIKGKSFALVGLFLFAINPWHIMMSRWGLECNLFPQVFLLALYVLLKGEEKPLLYPLSLFFFGLSLYAYGTAYMFVPFFLLVYGIYLLKARKITGKMFVISLFVFMITAVPILIFMIINVFSLPPLDWGFISFPRLVRGRYNTTVTVLNGQAFASMGKNLVTFLKLLVSGQDGLIWNSMPFFGVLYGFSLPLLVLGLFCGLKGRGRMLILSLLAASLVLALLSDLNINRANIIFVLCIYLVAEGLYVLLLKCKRVHLIAVGIYAVCFCAFVASYFTVYQDAVGRAFFAGFGEALAYVNGEKSEKVYLTDTVNSPYIYALFYDKTNPEFFINTVDYEYENVSVRPVRSFAHYVTGVPDVLQENEFCIASLQEAEQFDDEYYSKKQYKHYCVVSRRE